MLGKLTVLFSGILSLLMAALIILMDLRYPNTLAEFLGIDILDQYDECVMREYFFFIK